MKTFFLLLAPIMTWAQTNYKSGNITDCHTWALFADKYTTLNNINIINGSVINCNKNTEITSIVLNGTGAINLNDKSINLVGGRTDVKCGGVYGSDLAGTGKFKYTYSTSCFLVCYGNYDYKTLTVKLGPLKRNANYRWAGFKGTLFNYKGGRIFCESCWISDWDFIASYVATNGRSDAIQLNIPVGDKPKSSKCGQYTEYFDAYFDFYDRYFPEDTYITVSLKVIGPSWCCVNPIMFFDLSISLEEL